MVKNLPANARDRGLIPGWEDLLEKELTTHSSILTWRTPWTEEPGGPRGPKELDTTWRLNSSRSKLEYDAKEKNTCYRRSRSKEANRFYKEGEKDKGLTQEVFIFLERCLWMRWLSDVFCQ